MKKVLIKKISSLPPLPNSVIELENFRSLDSFDVEKLMDIINEDPLMVATILRIANSSMFGFRSEVDTLSRAINLLGMNFTISIAIGSTIQNTLDTNLCAYAVTNDDFLKISALATNILNTWFSSVDFDLKESLLLPAFLQQIGKYVISDVIQENKLTEAFLNELDKTKDIPLCEEHFTGLTSNRITANIFKYWSFNHKVIFPIAFVDSIDECPQEFKKQAQILEILLILCDIREPLSDENIEKAIQKASKYGFDIEHLANSIDVIKETIQQNS